MGVFFDTVLNLYNIIKITQEALKGIYLSKALTCINFFLYKQKMLFIKETDTSGHVDV